MDEKTGFCAGCYRTIDEIADWAYLTDDAKQAILDQLKQRKQSG